jgi:hypothetical protein
VRKITFAADLRRGGQQWPEIYKAISPDIELTHKEQHRLQSAVYYRLDDSQRKPPAPTNQIATYDEAREEAQKLVESLRSRSPRKLAHTLDPNTTMDARSIRRILRDLRLGRPRVTIDSARIVALRQAGRSWSEITLETGLTKGTAQRAYYGQKACPALPKIV